MLDIGVLLAPTENNLYVKNKEFVGFLLHYHYSLYLIIFFFFFMLFVVSTPPEPVLSEPFSSIIVHKVILAFQQIFPHKHIVRNCKKGLYFNLFIIFVI